MVTSQNGAFATSIPLSAFSEATQPSATQAQTQTIFSSVAVASTLTSGGSTVVVTTTIVVPTAVVTTVADPDVFYAESMTIIPVTVSLTTSSSGPQATPVGFKNQIDTSNPFVGVQVWKAEIFEADTSNSWVFILDGKTQQPIAGNTQWTVTISANVNGTEAIETFAILPNIGPDKATAMLSIGQTFASYYIQITTRLYRETIPTSKVLKRFVDSSVHFVRAASGPLQFTDSSALGQFDANIQYPVSSTTSRSTTSRTTLRKTSTTTKSTSVKSSATTTTKRVPTPTNWIVAETCSPGKKYNNAKNCCCKPAVTRRVTKTITVNKFAKATPKSVRDDYLDHSREDLIGKDELYARQINVQHLCGACPLSKPGVKIVCCLPQKTVTKIAKTVYKTRTA